MLVVCGKGLAGALLKGASVMLYFPLHLGLSFLARRDFRRTPSLAPSELMLSVFLLTLIGSGWELSHSNPGVCPHVQLGHIALSPMAGDSLKSPGPPRINPSVQLKPTDFKLSSNSVPLCLTIQSDLRVRPILSMGLSILR